MKPISSLIFALCAATTITAAHAATKCVKFNSTQSCTLQNPSGGGNPYITTICPDNISVSIVGVCSSTTGNQNDVSNNIKTSNSNNIHCWCKMVSPAVSSWVKLITAAYSSTDNCKYNCGANCASTFSSANSTLRSTIFSNLID